MIRVSLFFTGWFLLAGLSMGQTASPTPVPVYPKDWATTDGQMFHHVKVISVESDYVTIIHDDGGGTIPLSTLTPNLQQIFHYPHTYILRLTHGGIRYKDIVIGSGSFPASNDVITVTLKPADHATKLTVKEAVDAQTKVLLDKKAAADKDLTDAEALYDKKAISFQDLQNAQNKVSEVSVRLDALQTNTMTFLFGTPDIIPGLNEVVANMKVGGKRTVEPLPPPPNPDDDAPTPTPSPTPTPTPTLPANAPPPPPKLSYEIDFLDLQPAAQ